MAILKLRTTRSGEALGKTDKTPGLSLIIPQVADRRLGRLPAKTLEKPGDGIAHGRLLRLGQRRIDFVHIVFLRFVAGRAQLSKITLTSRKDGPGQILFVRVFEDIAFGLIKLF